MSPGDAWFPKDWLPPANLVQALTVVLQPWLATFLFIQIGGWWIYRQQAPIDAFSLPVYTLSALCSAAFWLLLQLVRDGLGRLARATVAAAAGLFAPFVVVGSYQVYIEFGEFLSASMVSYAGKGGISTFAYYLETYLQYPLSLFFVVGLPLIGLLWWFGPRAKVFSTRLSGGPRQLRSIALVGLVFVSSLAGSALLAHRRHLAPDVSIVVAGIRSLYMPEDDRLHAPDRTEIPAEPPADGHPPPNIVLVVNESLGTHVVDFGNDDIEGMPRIESWLQQSDGRTFAFDRGYANSTSTDVSVPSMMTGLGPHRPPGELHEVPLAWDWARRAGLSPFYVSSQNYYSTHFPEFFFAGDPMPVIRPNTMTELEQSGDFPVDELYAASRFVEQLEAMPDDTPIFAVYNSNAMHKPFQGTSRLLDEQPDRGSDYRNALIILDHALDRIRQGLADEGRLANTLFVMTSDHGEYSERKHRVPRILSTYEEFIRIPFVIRVPADWNERRSDELEGLDRNLDRNVANVDIVPTLVDVLGFDRVPETLAVREMLTGESLVSPVPRDRMIYVLNNNAVRHWEHRSFGLVWGDWRFVFSDVQGPRLFDIAEDPPQRNDLWKTAPHRTRKRVLQTIRSNRYLSRIWNTSRPRGTPGFEPILQ